MWTIVDGMAVAAAIAVIKEPPLTHRLRVMVSSLVQPPRQFAGKLVIALDMVMLTKFIQFRNGVVPRLVTVSGMISVVKPLQPINALLPIVPTLEGMVIAVKPLDLNALSAIVLIPLGMFTNVKAVQVWNAPSPIAVKLEGNVKFARTLHEENAFLPMEATLLCRLTVVRAPQF
jgi:hypothetical protein